MEAKQRKIVELFAQSNTQFTIPVYQRDYNWEDKQCGVLLKNILDLSISEENKTHFIGSIVYMHEGVYTLGVNEYSIIDGQQRLTTLTLLFLALAHEIKGYNDKLYNKIYNRYIIDEYLDREYKFKLIQPEENLELLEKIINEKIEELDEFKDRNIVKNYIYFRDEFKKLEKEKLERIEIGIEKLIYVDIALEKGKDDPQKIFESLNSTGLDLSQSDLIRNYILMDLGREEQNRVFKKIWLPIENNCKVSDGTKITSYVSNFIRDYLTLKTANIPTKNKVFEIFKEYYKDKDILDELKYYSEIYEVILKPELEKDKDIQKRLKNMKSLDQTVANPFLMGIMNDLKKEKISKKVFEDIIDLLESYLWRRYITEKPTNSLNHLFRSLYSKLELDNYYNSFENVIKKHDFPDNEELRHALKTKAVYKDKGRLNYFFEKMENFHHNELIDFNNEKITIEHIFPQKPSSKWREILSEKEIDEMLSLKDTISNLTLTGSNSNLGNKSFIEKRDEKVHGYRYSKLFMNKWLGEQKEWNLEKLNERFELLFESVLKIWKMTSEIEIKNEQEEAIIFYTKNLKAKGILKDNKFLVLKGSIATKEQTESVEKRTLPKIQELLKSGVLKETEDSYIFIDNCLFTSPSTPANIILGRSANGWTEWKSEDGVLLDSFRKKNKGVDKIREYLKEKLEIAKLKGLKSVDIRAGELEKELEMRDAAPTVCNAMKTCGYDYEIIKTPPKGNGTTLTLRYKL